MDDDPHFRKIAQNEAVRVFTLNLDRLESTSSICQDHRFFYVVTSESESTDILQDHAGISHRWRPGAARFVPGPEVHIIRNETGTPHREVIVEILSKLEFNAFTDSSDRDNFPVSPGSGQASWSVAVEHGAMSAVKSQLAPGYKLDAPGFTKVLIAVTDSMLNAIGRDFQLSKQDVEVLSPESDFTITNTGRFPARFITIAF